MCVCVSIAFPISLMRRVCFRASCRRRGCQPNMDFSVSFSRVGLHAVAPRLARLSTDRLVGRYASLPPSAYKSIIAFE